MSGYLYPVRLTAQIVYPDILPVLSSPSSQYEAAFKAIPAIAELIVQRIGDGALPPESPFVQVLPGHTLLPGYNSVELDEAIYVFKQEYDPILISRGQLRYEVPQLSDILSKEIAFVEREGFPLGSVPEEERAANMVRLMDEFLVQSDAAAAGLSGYDRLGWLGGGDEALASQAVATVKAEIIKGNPFVNDLIIQSLSIVSPFINLAFQIVLSIISTVSAVVQAAAGGAPLVAAFASGVAALGQTITTSATAAVAAFSAAASATVVGLALSMFLFVASNLIMDMVSEYRQWAKYTRELRRQRESIRATFAQSVLEVEAEITQQKQKARENVTQYRLMLAEMIARTLRGEVLLGLVEKTPDGKWILTYTVDEKYKAEGGELTSGASGSMGPAVAMIAGAVILRALAR